MDSITKNGLIPMNRSYPKIEELSPPELRPATKQARTFIFPFFNRFSGLSVKCCINGGKYKSTKFFESNN